MNFSMTLLRTTFFTPTLIDLKYMLQVFGALTGIEVYLASILENAKNGYSSTAKVTN